MKAGEGICYNISGEYIGLGLGFEEGRRRPGRSLQRNTEKTKHRCSPECRVDERVEGRTGNLSEKQLGGEPS